jgi:AAA family ATP:ADP antiporter
VTFPGADGAARPDKGPIERLLSPFADVRRGEAAGVLLMTLLMFLLLSGYYLLKTAREVFILSEGGAEVKSYASAGQAILLLVLVPAYGAFAARVGRAQLVSWVPLFFAFNLLLFAAAERGGMKIGVPYFLWLGIFNVMVIAQFWAFANDIYTPEQGRRLFPLIGVGSSLGAWIGSVRAGVVMDAFGPLRLLFGGAVILVLCVFLARIVDRRTRRVRAGAGGTTTAPAPAPPDEPLGGTQSGFSMLFADRYLMLIALLTIVLNIVNTSGEYIFGRFVVDTATAMHGAGEAAAEARGQFIGDAYSRFYGHVNLLGLVLQMFVVSRVFKFLGVGRALFIHPIIAGAGYLFMLRTPSFEMIRVLKTVDNAVDYSLNNTTKQALWLPTSRQAKYKAKQAVDSFCVRAGDVIQAGMVYGGEYAALGIPAFAAINVGLTAGWVAIAAALNRRLQRPADVPHSVV